MILSPSVRLAAVVASCVCLFSLVFTLASAQEAEASEIEGVADPSGLSSPSLADHVAELNLVGLWSGRDAGGVVVSYVFEEDGTAAIYENEKPVLAGSDDGSTVTWELHMNGRRGSLDINYTNGRGASEQVKYAARFSNDGELVLRSGGQDGIRPSDTTETADRMQIRLIRQY